MKTKKKFYLQVPGIGRLIVEETGKKEAVKIYEAMGYDVTCESIRLVKNKNPGDEPGRY